MNKIKKAVIFILTIAFILPAFSACGKTEKFNVNLTLWNYYNDSQRRAFDEVIDKFNTTEGANYGISITTESISTDTYEYAKTLTSSAKGELGAKVFPDIFLTYADTAKAVDAYGKLASLNSYFTTEELNQYVQSFLDEGKIDDTNNIKIFPTAKSTEILMLNKTDWEKFQTANPDINLDMLDTMEGLMNVSEKYYEWSGGKAFYGRDSLANYFIIGAKQLGVELFSKSGDGSIKIDADKTVMRKLWDSYYVPYMKGHFTVQGRFRTDDLDSEYILAATGSSAGTAYLPKTIGADKHSVEFLILETPYFADGTRYAFQQGAGFAIAESSNKDKIKAAAIFLKWFTEEERNIEFALQSSYLPVKKSALAADKVEEIIAAKSTFSDATKQSLRVCADMINDGIMYVNKAHPDGNDIRQIFERNVDSDMLNILRAEIVEKCGEGLPESEVLADYIGNAAFNTWYANLLASLADYI